jgi:hypothetical protein
MERRGIDEFIGNGSLRSWVLRRSHQFTSRDSNYSTLYRVEKRVQMGEMCVNELKPCVWGGGGYL